MMKRYLAVLLALVLCLGLAAIPASADATNALTVSVGPDPDTMDPALSSSVDVSIMMDNLFSALYGYANDPDGKLIVVPDIAEAIVTPTAIDGGKFEYVIKLRDGVKWSDGQPLKASDFVYSWNRAVNPETAADYQYMFDVIDGYDEENPQLNIIADDEAGTVTVVTAAFCAYFDQLLAFPTFMPVRRDIIEQYGDKWATQVESYISNGPFKMVEWNIGDKIVLAKNEYYWDTANVALDSLTFALTEDDQARFANYESGTYQLTSGTPIAQVPVLKADPARMDVDFFILPSIGTYFIDFNTNVSFAPGIGSAGDSAEAWANWTPAKNADVRRALALLLDRNYVVEQITQSGQIPANGFVPAGMDDGTGTEFRKKAASWWSVDPADYDANCAQAVEILKQYYAYDEKTMMFTDFPTFEFSVNPTTGNLAMVAAFQDTWQDYGINITVDQRSWTVIRDALQKGDFTASRMGWIADFNDPINFLDIFIPASGNNYPQLGRSGDVGLGAYYGANGDQTWVDAYLSLTSASKLEADPAKRADLLYAAEVVMRDSYAVIPVYYYTASYMVNPMIKNVLISPLGGIYFKDVTLQK